MGFTFSHPALILPFKYLPRKFYSLSGLVIGSMVPDLEYFIRFDNLSFHSHSLLGLFWFDIPAGILIGIIFHQVMRDKMINNLPLFLKSRFIRFQFTNWLEYLKKNIFVVIGSILVGALTHIFWDSFTSYNGYFVKSIPVLRMKFHFAGDSITFYKIIKYLSSLLGAIIIVYCIHKLPKIKEVKISKRNKYYWILAISLFTPVFLLRLLLIDRDEISPNGVIKAAISSGLIALVITSFFYRKQHAFR